MSRIGKRVLTIPANVNVNVNENKITVKGPKGELSLDLIKTIRVNVEGNQLTVEKLKEDKFTNQMHGTTNANINNMIDGVNEGFKKEPIMTALLYSADLEITFIQSLAGGISNTAVLVIIGLPILFILSKRYASRTNLVEETEELTEE